ncbi:MAG TPA: hypothetical protein ENI97_00885 [Gammaproteobacteria bacterium]|nr:hypothetical protein [Gammaproteobacteria bacterium]
MIFSRERRQSLIATSCWRNIGVWGGGANRCEKLKIYVHCRNCPVFSSAGRSVFEKVPPSGYLADWRREIAAASKESDERSRSILIFRIYKEWYAFPVRILNEISSDRSVHKIPRNTRSSIEGIVNINGEIKLCYSLQEILGTKADSSKNYHKNGVINRRLIVAELGGYEYVFRVNEIKGMAWFSDHELLPAPSTIDSDHSELLLGILQMDALHVAVFNADMLQDWLEKVAL